MPPSSFVRRMDGWMDGWIDGENITQQSNKLVEWLLNRIGQRDVVVRDEGRMMYSLERIVITPSSLVRGHNDPAIRSYFR